MHKIRAEKLLAKKYYNTEKLTNWDSQLESSRRRKAGCEMWSSVNGEYTFSLSGHDVRYRSVDQCWLHSLLKTRAVIGPFMTCEIHDAGG